jgi:hypothetical protein
VTFAHPLLLLGAAAALIPLLVHLFDRRRPRPHPFAAIAFVLRSQRRTASRLKLRRLLLYTLRTLILLALPLALARPELRTQGAVAGAPGGPAATAIVLDASLSMRYRLDGTSLFERGRSLARDALKDLNADEPATVLSCAQDAAPPVPVSFDRGRLRTFIDDAQPSHGGADLNRCLEVAARSLEDSPVATKRIIVVSDFTVPSLHLDAPPPTTAGPKGEAVHPSFVLRDAADGRPALPNHALVDLRVEPSVQLGPRAYQFTFKVHNFSAEPVKDLVALLKVGDRVVAKGFVDLGPGAVAQKSLSYVFEAGGIFTGSVTLGPDALAEDDVRTFVVRVPKELQALVINGAPSSVRYRDEAFFVDAALGAGGSPVHETLRDTESAFQEPLQPFDLVFLLNVRAPPPEMAAKLVDFVHQGGGLFISMGDEVDPESYNRVFKELLPRPLRLVKTSAIPGEPEAEAKASKLGQLNFDHPLFSLFTGRAREGLLSARFYRYMLLESSESKADEGGSQVLATYEDGAPAFALARRGKGRVLLYTSTVDRDWGDLAIRTAFLPLLQRTAALLTGSLEERDEVRAVVGDTVTLKPESAQGLSAVTAPSGPAVPLKAQPDGTWLAGPLPEPGLYTPLDAKGAPLAALTFVARLDAAQSDTTRLKPDELAAYFGEDAVRQASAGGSERKTPLWTWLILAAAVAFFLEGVLLRKV